MANVQSPGESHQVSEALTPSASLEQSHEDLVSDVCFPSLSYLPSPDRTEAEEAVVWFMNYTSDQVVYTDVPLHQSEPLSETREDMLSDLNAACLLDTDLFQLSDQSRDIEPPYEFHSGRQEAKHQHIHSVPTFPSFRDPCSPKHPSEIFPFPHPPCVTFHHARALHATRGLTSIPSQHHPRFISIPPADYTTSQQCFSFNTCQVHQPVPPYIFTPSHVSVRFPSHLSVLNLNPLNAERPSETLDCTFSRNQSWHTRETPRDVQENFRVWQRFCETAKGFYFHSPDVEALACFFLYDMGSLTVHHINDAVNAAVRKWNKKPAAEREIYYTSAIMFIQLQEERRFIQNGFELRGHVSQHSSGKERSAVLSGCSEVMSGLEVKDRSEVNAVNKVSSTFPSTPTSSNVPGREKVLKPVAHKRMRRAAHSDAFTAARRMKRFTNSTKTRQTVNEIIRYKRQNEPQMRHNRKLKQQVKRDTGDRRRNADRLKHRRLSETTDKLHKAKY